MRYTKASRLRKRVEINFVFKRGKSAQDELIRIHVITNSSDSKRLAISIKRKLCNSVERNRWKRLVREAFRLNMDRLKPGLDLVVSPLVKPQGLVLKDVETSFLNLNERLGHLSN